MDPLDIPSCIFQPPSLQSSPNSALPTRNSTIGQTSHSTGYFVSAIYHEIYSLIKMRALGSKDFDTFLQLPSSHARIFSYDISITMDFDVPSLSPSFSPGKNRNGCATLFLVAWTRSVWLGRIDHLCISSMTTFKNKFPPTHSRFRAHFLYLASFLLLWILSL